MSNHNTASSVHTLSRKWLDSQISIRDYQRDCVAKILRNLNKDLFDKKYFSRRSPKRELLVAPTGSGKTLMTVSIAWLFCQLGYQVLFVVHRDRLITQTIRTAKALSLNSGVIAGERKENRKELFQIASFQTLNKNRDLSWLQPRLVICDEAHYVAFSSIMLELASKLPLKNELFDYLGTTATPVRFNDEESLGEIFDSCTIAAMPRDLISQGYLSGGRYYSIQTSVANENGNGRCSIPHIYREWYRLGKDRKTISFSNRVSRAKEIAEYFKSQGIKAECVYGAVSRKKREYLYDQLEQGDLQLLSSCLALNEGFDCPRVDALIYDKDTLSYAAYLQSMGRGSRPYPGKKYFLVLDATGVVHKHGFLESVDFDERCLDLGVEKLQRKTPLKICPSCGKYLAVSYKRCPSCNHLFPKSEKPVSIDSPLVRLFWNEDEKRRYAYWNRLRTQADRKFKGNYLEAERWVAEIYQETIGMSVPCDWEEDYRTNISFTLAG